ncbi:F0F1 ATP synthase subunit B [Aminobacter sp. AP02]|uniref:F0F1 ATP synthase subunit B n=1 Tax=Aminobacter sp. AP02 TaxID=2135737 RepID=UPI000D6AD6E1|nr:F0F1 ATP synthase subunit B [Aminobacter sp. AP02]PWK68209.1 F-type H+-transporting ATPase subunit b [Aminobacter sp. AP02]
MFVTPGYAEEVAPAAGATQTDAGASAHTSTGAEHGAKGVFPPFDSSSYPSQLLWLAITFGLFYLFLKNAVLPRVGGILEVRRDRIAGDLDQAARMKSEADAAVAAYEQELAEAKARANAIGQEARDAAKAEAEAKRKEVEAGLDQKLTTAEARIATIKANAMKEVGTIAEDTAAAIVQALGAGKVDKADIAAAVKAAGK